MLAGVLLGLLVRCLCKVESPLSRWKKINRVNPLRRTTGEGRSNSKIVNFLAKFRTKKYQDGGLPLTVTQPDTQIDELNLHSKYDIHLVSEQAEESKDSTNENNNKVRFSEEVSALSNRLDHGQRNSFAFALLSSWNPR